jgi:ribosomal protein L11 methyltransferase
MNYYCYEIEAESYQVDILTALLGELPFDSFEETDSGLKAYIPESEYSESVEETITDYAEEFDFQYVRKHIPSQNWNAVWEANFQPIQVGNFAAVRADFHPPIAGVIHDIVIHPNMAFGTGHHETTYMMMEAMQTLDFKNKYVFDYGCGTGILAILASKLLASQVEAVDIQKESYEATLQNSKTNRMNNIRAVQGTLEAVHEADFDVILANINRNVISDSLSTLYKKLKPSGKLLISGFMTQDEPIMRQYLAPYDLSILQILHRGYWLCMVLEKMR